MAKEGLGSLPINQDSMNNVSKFLTQTADFSEYAIKKLAERKLDDKDYEILKDINTNVITLTDTLDNIYREIEKGRCRVYNEH